jgi:outer membrane protein assembly factor BamB
MNRFRTIILVFTLAGAYLSGNAQEALWQLDLEKEVEWNKITDVGILLIGSSDMILYGVDSRNGEILWKTDIMKGAKGVKGADGKKQEVNSLFEQFLRVLQDDEVPEISDYIEIKYTDNAAFKNYAIINLQTGEEIISPRQAGMPLTKLFGKEMPTFNFYGTGYLVGQKAVIISASWIDYNQKGNPEIAITKLVDLPSAKIRWESTEIATNVIPIEDTEGNLVMGGNKIVARLNSKTGATMWKFEVTEKKQTFESFDVSLDLTKAYFFEKVKKSGQLTALDLNTGGKIWTTEVKLKVVPQMFAISDGVVIVDDKFFTLFDLNTGETKWQTKKATGIVVDLGEPGIAVAARGTRLMLLDRNTGAIKWDERVKGIGIDRIAAKGIMYSDVKGRIGIITYEGEKVWDKRGLLPPPEVRYQPEFTKELIYAEGNLYEVDLVAGEYKVLKDNIDKEFTEDELPTSIELLEGGYLLAASNNLMMLETDGSVRWHKSWNIPEMSVAAKIAWRTAQIIAAAAAASASYNAQNAGWGSEAKYYESQAASWSNTADIAGANASQKFTATKSKGNIQVILAVIGDGGQKKGAGLVKVDKRSGEEQGSLILGDKEPVYDYDPISGQVFYKSDKKQLLSYSF